MPRGPGHCRRCCARTLQVSQAGTSTPRPHAGLGDPTQTPVWEGMGRCGGDTTTYSRPNSNGGVIASKCLQGACIKREGKGGALHHLRKKQGGEAGLGQFAPPQLLGPGSSRDPLAPCPG